MTKDSGVSADSLANDTKPSTPALESVKPKDSESLATPTAAASVSEDLKPKDKDESGLAD